MVGIMSPTEGASRSEKCANKILSSGGKTDSRNTTRKNRIFKKKLFSEDDISSPVLGLRILPAAPSQPTLSAIHLSVSATQNKPLTGNFTCKLCQTSFADPLTLASHRCVRIQNVQYTCPECGKSFNCPANLASHRRWHKPRNAPLQTDQASSNKETNAAYSSRNDKDAIAMPPNKTDMRRQENVSRENRDKEDRFSCSTCGKLFRRRSYLKYHIATKHIENTIAKVPNKTDAPNMTKMNEEKTNPENINSHPERDSESLGGLDALAYAAEFHSRLSPQFCQTEKHKVETLIKKRSATEDIGNPPTKAVKGNFLDGKKIPWLPPSPPRSDLSSSPRSVSSEDNETNSANSTTLASVLTYNGTDFNGGTRLVRPSYSKNRFLTNGVFISPSMDKCGYEQLQSHPRNTFYFPDPYSLLYNYKHHNFLTSAIAKDLPHTWRSIATPAVWNHPVYTTRFNTA